MAMAMAMAIAMAMAMAIAMAMAMAPAMAVAMAMAYGIILYGVGGMGGGLFRIGALASISQCATTGCPPCVPSPWP